MTGHYQLPDCRPTSLDRAFIPDCRHSRSIFWMLTLGCKLPTRTCRLVSCSVYSPPITLRRFVADKLSGLSLARRLGNLELGLHRLERESRDLGSLIALRGCGLRLFRSKGNIWAMKSRRQSARYTSLDSHSSVLSRDFAPGSILSRVRVTRPTVAWSGASWPLPAQVQCLQCDATASP